MLDLPSGTVTFLFTDVEGSTRLLHELGALEAARAAHPSLWRHLGTLAHAKELGASSLRRSRRLH